MNGKREVCRLSGKGGLVETIDRILKAIKEKKKIQGRFQSEYSAEITSYRETLNK